MDVGFKDGCCEGRLRPCLLACFGPKMDQDVRALPLIPQIHPPVLGGGSGGRDAPGG